MLWDVANISTFDMVNASHSVNDFFIPSIMEYVRFDVRYESVKMLLARWNVDVCCVD
jgi:hypothetical protein